MWTKNGAATLPAVLAKIAVAVPAEFVNKKIMVDDSSEDLTAIIGATFGWTVLHNVGGGIGNGANIALKNVESEYFCTFEQDLLLANDWFSRIAGVLDMDRRVACVQGIRFALNPSIRRLERYTYRRSPPSSMDNNIFLTEAVKRIGGFPADCPVCVDARLKLGLERAGYSWIFAEDVVSTHLKGGVREYVRGQAKFFKRCTQKDGCTNIVGIPKMLRLFLSSPIRAFTIAVAKKDFRLLFIYPYLRLSLLWFRVANRGRF